MEGIIFGRITNYFILLHDGYGELEYKKVLNAPKLFNELILNNFKVNNYYSKSDIQKILQDVKVPDYDKFRCFRVKSVIAFFPTKWLSQYFPYIETAYFNYLGVEKYAESLRMRLSLESRKFLLESIFLKKIAHLSETLEAFRKYTFSNHYSLWVYNSSTKTFSLVCSSGKYQIDHITLDKNTSLNDVLKDVYMAEKRRPDKRFEKNSPFSKAKSLTRIKLDFSANDNSVGILSFYSNETEHFIADKLLATIKSFLETKYREYIQIHSEKFENVVNSFLEVDITDGLNPLLYDLVNKICDNLSFEACSIFLKDETGRNLELQAIRDLYHDGAPSEQVVYSLNQSGLTVDVFNSTTTNFGWSYKLDRDDRNSHKLDEACKLGNKNWIGFRVEDGKDTYGVIRVKNKFTNVDNIREARHLRPIDFYYLATINDFLAGYLKILNIITNLNDGLVNLNKNIDDRNVFDLVFLHELRNPIQSFFSAPERILREISRPPITEVKLDLVRKKLTDIRTLAGRFKFLTDTYYFDQIVTSRSYKYISVLHDIVFPVLNVSRDFIKLKYLLDIQINDTRLSNIKVYGEQNLLMIVVNALIDNAAKYGEKDGRPITIDGQYTKGNSYFELSVSNYGMWIEKEDSNTIFDQGKRGEIAQRVTDGTGIGLFLTKRIMEEHKGSIRLKSRRNPVTFSIEVPVNEEIMNSHG